MPKPKIPKITAAFVRAYRGNNEAQQEAALLAYGVPKGKIAYASKCEMPEQMAHRVRGAGEALAIAGTLRVLGDRRKAIRAAVDALEANGGGVFDIITERDTRRKGVQMMDDALAWSEGEARTPDDPEARRELSRLGGLAKGKNARKGRMSKREALPYWRDASLTVEQALQIIGWPRALAYNKVRGLGPRGVSTGRKTKEQ